ncbi:hypothetical protein MTBLM5_280004 [Magnetospirillum sp. LM-5]|uniref:class I SAM-dependent methyltransferase n=1 Tax=Magnetospirillum sp. LM-5 TaxID=2681466 RepID=UPI0013817F82|nr:class I SAM-dependent methyltransferase [Magnetospirillum sp. LM-5]CAA7618716.1 hypothetical protein MTBLM5_280004 [Magnetospirillum sp. LM-5]
MVSYELKNKDLQQALQNGISHDQQQRAIEDSSGGYYYSPDQEFDDKLKVWVIEEALRHLRPGRVLDLGYINDIWTRALLADSRVSSVDIVEAAVSHVDRANQDLARTERVRVFHTLFEDFQPDTLYDTILMSGVVKHVPDDDALVRKAMTWLAPGGVVIASTPNCRAFHRRLGTYMGLELAPDRHNNRDQNVFNVHIYDRFSWRALFVRNGYHVREITGVGMKVLGTEQLRYLGERYDIDRILEGLRWMATEMPDYAWYLVLVAEAA